MVTAIRYTAAMAGQWDDFVSHARNSTLLHLRQYMDYHADRFHDVSLVMLDDKERIVALLPACLSRDEKAVVTSHGGLTYGGYIIAPMTHADTVGEAVEASLRFYREQLGASELVVKPIPYIYNRQPCEEELYFILRHGGRLTERHLSQAVCTSDPLPANELRRRCIAKGRLSGLLFTTAEKREEWDEYHRLLTQVLSLHHSTAPVHSAEELWLLHSRFPDNIKLYTARLDGRLMAGTVIYLSPCVAHTQYLASSDQGRGIGALDYVIDRMLSEADVRQCAYLDFGVSTERDGTLNQGLTFQKEGFGARGVCYDTYRINL